jgi:hypothetical protein
MATSNQYDVNVATRAHRDAVQALANQQNALLGLERRLLTTAIKDTLTTPEFELLKNSRTINFIPEDRRAIVNAQFEKLKATPSYKQLQTEINTSQTAVKLTQLDLNAAINGTRITQGKAGPDLSPAIDPNAKQVPYVVRTPGATSTLTGVRQVTPPGANNSDLLNNPTGLILGATALAAITSNPNLISSIGSGIGRFFNNAGDILPVSTNVPSAPAPVNPESVPAPVALPPVGETTATAAPVASDEALAVAQAAQEVADLQIAAASSTPVDIQTDGLLEQQQAILQAQEEAQFNARLDRAAELDLSNSGDAALEAAARAREAADLRTALTFEAAPVQDDATGGAGTNVAQNQADVDANNSVARGATNRAQQQSTLQTRVNQPAAADWRVRLRLAPNADYLYKVPAGNDPNSGPGILAPLAATDGVVFPYTPAIETSYQAKYANYDLTHSNYRGYFYQNSSIENITIKGTFTAQDTREAAYLLAVIHFFKSVTKMFYGQDQQAGTPPPLVYLSGFGKYQFNESPCVVTNFGYSLPTDVDYIRANGFNNIGLNMENRRNQSSGPAIGGSLGTVVAILDRLNNAGLKNKSLTDVPSPGAVNQNVTNQTSINSTYVPTKMEISITLLPMQTRNQVSKQFSLKSFANGSLLAGGGFW